MKLTTCQSILVSSCQFQIGLLKEPLELPSNFLYVVKKVMPGMPFLIIFMTVRMCYYIMKMTMCIITAHLSRY
jgi:hypothetical protein